MTKVEYRILVVAPDQLLTRSGGLRTQVQRTCQEMEKLGVSVTYFNPWEIYDFNQYDLVHIFSMNAPNFYKSEIFNHKLPIVFSSVMWREGNRNLIKFIVNFILKLPIQLINDTVSCKIMSNFANVILPNTKAELNWLNDCVDVNVDKCVVVPNGADNFFENYTDEFLIKNSSIKIDKDFVFCCSVISQRKNLIRLAKACININIPLVIAGPVVDSYIYDQLLELSKRSNLELIFLGHLAPDSYEMGYLLRFNKVFCLPSFYETPGIAALEAGLQGSNIVITNVGGTEEYFGDMALYIDPYSSTDIENKIRAALKRNWTEKDRVNIKRHIEKNFSWKMVANKTIMAYEKIK
ncbi:glycosyltransferase [Vibrio cholerae]|uniref:glycosyltransferase family 4 protein n=1 Tax=Vibrio cholerae TaxID=666 RepID=UPI00115720C8|nr:glycosyltransferase family 4 protein [Vibrio cholerae]EGR2123069.1 glycosyltransferase [Vibrio cholerae]TQP94135.1 glycosyltransferase family 4 protein [Vibrio cholerae]